MSKKIIAFISLISLLTLSALGISNNVRRVQADYSTSRNEIEAPSADYTSEHIDGIPSGYYSAVDGLSGDPLLEKLANITYTKHRYYNTYGEIRSANAFSDADPNSDTNLLDFYTKLSIDDTWDSGSLWNREHVWCQSLSGGLYDVDNSSRGAGADIHHLRPEITNINSSRNNSLYGDLNSNASYAKYYNVDTGKVSSSGELFGYIDSSTDPLPSTSLNEGVFEPLDHVKGDVARILMYLYMHYSTEVDYNSANSYAGNLVITNIVYTSSRTTQAAWNLLLDWNDLDPVDDFERNRNTYCAAVTGTRNPFIDHDEYAEMIWDTSYSGPGANEEDYSSEESSSSSISSSSEENQTSEDSVESSSSSSSETTSEEHSSEENSTNYETTYTVQSVSSVSRSGTAATGVSATFNSTYTSKYQLTSGNSATLNVSNLTGYKVSKIILSMKSNSSKGSGSLKVTSGGTTLKEIEACGFNSSSWNGAWSTEYVDIVVDDLASHTINDGEDLKIVIAATENSLYIQKYTIFYEKAGENDNTPTLNSLQQIIEKYYNNGVYTKKTNINLSEYAIEDIQEYFHGSVDLDRTTYYKGNALLMGDLDGGFANINSGYGTDASGNMTHFTWNQETQETEIDYTVNKGEHQNWKDKDIDGMEGFYVTLNDMLQEGYFDDWTENKYSVANTNDAYFNDFLAFVAPCLYSSIASTNFVTINELIISEETHETYGDYLCFQITLDTTSKGVADNEELILAESRVYIGNVVFNENETTNELEPTTITRTIASLASENGWSNATAYRENIALDNIVTINTSTSGNTAKYYTSDNTWRFYASDASTLTISVPTGYQISSVSITYAGGSLAVNDSTYLSDSNVIVEGEAITFQASSGTVKISSISVTYIKL